MEIMHIGLTVKDLDRSVAFYRDVLGLAYVGQLQMSGPETETLFDRPGCKARVAYLKCEGSLSGPLIELIQFVSSPIEEKPADLFRTSISEICFETKDMDAFCQRLEDNHVELLSRPQPFDFRESGFGRSKAVYFRDPDGIILEAMENL